MPERSPSTFDEWVILVVIGVLVVGGVALMLARSFILEIMIVLVSAGLVGAVFASWRLHEDLGPGVPVESVHEGKLAIGIVIAFVVVFAGLISLLAFRPEY